MHKKAASLMGGSSHAHQRPNFTQETNLFEIGKSSHQPSMLNSQKQSYNPSQQNSFNDYSSNTNQGYIGGEIRGITKIDNFLLNEKSSSLLTAQQQLQLKNYQKLQETQLQQTADSLGNGQFGGTRYNIGGSIDIQHIGSQTQGNGFKSFDQRPPINQLINQSQRVSIMSIGGDNNSTTINSQNHPGFRSHTNSFQSSSNIAMKYPPNKYVKGVATDIPDNSGKNKKTLQYHHQRTFSDNANATNGRGQILNINSGLQTGQNTNRNFKELIKSVNDKDFVETGFINGINISNTEVQQNYPISSVTSSVNMNTQQIQGYNQKITIGSSRQSAQSQVNIDEREAFLQLIKSTNTNQADKYPDLKNIYQGVLKNDIQKTKQQLKLTQTQFGGPSRKVVQSSSNKVNANTQSYRATNAANTMTTTSSKIVSQMMTTEMKSTPKIFLTKSKKPSKNASQNTSSHGARGSHNVTQIQQMINQNSDKQNHKKNSQLFESSQASVVVNNISLTGPLAEMKKTKKDNGTAHIQHKRSASDGNSIFQSLSNRAHIDGSVNATNASVIYKGTNGKTSTNSNSNLETDDQRYSKRSSMSKISQGPGPYNIVKSNEYNIQSDRQQINGPKPQINQNVIINSHRQIGIEKHHQRVYSQQIDNQQQLQQPGQIPPINNQKSNSQIQMIQGKKRDIEMVIIDQDNFPSSTTSLPIKNSSKDQFSVNNSALAKNNVNSNPATLKPVEERIETQESAMSDPNLSPKTRKIIKISKIVKLAFQKTSNPPATSSDFYKIGKVMGKGAFGKVNLAIHRLSNKFVALKSINKTYLSEEASKRKVMQEFNILRRTRHRNIVRLYESFETAQHIVFVMEVCGAGDLLTYVRRRRKLKEDVAKHLFKQIVDGLRYCHSKGILHRDIKLDNILLTSEGDIKICDFGVSKLVRPGEIMTEQCGTPAYIAPEIFENKGYEGYASDVWSAGVVLYAMLYGTVPFKASNMTELQKQIIKCQTSFKDEISHESINLLKGILERDPAKRLSIPEILRHPWMQNINENVSVFTDQEKQKVDQEFEYYNFKNDNNPGEVIHTDPFTEQMLNSTQNSLIKNVSTKSIILAPFNSTKSHIDDNEHMRKSIQELLVEKKFFKFAAKVKEIDRQYEANNNAELDNGVYHQDSEDEKKEEEEEKKKAAEKKKNKYGSIETSFNKDDNNDNDDGQLQREIEEGQQMKKQSEWQKLEQMVIDKQKIEDEEEDNNHKSNTACMGSAMTLVIEDNLLNEIEKHGFPKTYLVNSLNNDDLNYATAYYYLLTTQKEF